jgi:hypothetical protein
MAPRQHPNDLETVEDGLGILDEAASNKAHKVTYGLVSGRGFLPGSHTDVST